MNTMSNNAYNVINMTSYQNHPYYSQSQSTPQLISFRPNHSESYVKANVLSVVPPTPAMTFSQHQLTNSLIPNNNCIHNNNQFIIPTSSPQIIYQMNHSITNSVNIPQCIRNTYLTQNTAHCTSVKQCLSTKRIIKLALFCNKYGQSNPVIIAQYIDNSKEYIHLKDDYQHYTLHILSSNDKAQIDEISAEYEKIFAFIEGFGNNITQGISTTHLACLNKRMDDIHNQISQDKTSNILRNVRPTSCNIYTSKNNPFVNNEPHRRVLSNKKNIQLLTCPTPPCIQSKTCTVTPIPLSPGPVTTAEVKHPKCLAITAARATNMASERIANGNVDLKTLKFEKYKCDKCNKAYKHYCNLKSHQKVHTDEALICPHCKKRFGRKANYNEHLRIHTGETPYQCRFCQRRFKHHHSWKDHVRIHTGENPYQCTVCYKRFKVGHNLTVHSRIHTGEKPYKCKFCEKLFRQKSGLNSHVKRIHNY